MEEARRGSVVDRVAPQRTCEGAGETGRPEPKRRRLYGGLYVGGGGADHCRLVGGPTTPKAAGAGGSVFKEVLDCRETAGGRKPRRNRWKERVDAFLERERGQSKWRSARPLSKERGSLIYLLSWPSSLRRGQADILCSKERVSGKGELSKTAGMLAGGEMRTGTVETPTPPSRSPAET